MYLGVDCMHCLCLFFQQMEIEELRGSVVTGEGIHAYSICLPLQYFIFEPVMEKF
jgi:hypothetical protein